MVYYVHLHTVKEAFHMLASVKLEDWMWILFLNENKSYHFPQSCLQAYQYYPQSFRLFPKMYFISSVIQSHASQLMFKIDGRCSESIKALKSWSATWSRILLQLRSLAWLRCETPHRPQCISKWYTIYWYGLHKIHTINKLCIDRFNRSIADSKFHSDNAESRLPTFQNKVPFKIRDSMDDDIMNIFGTKHSCYRLVYTERKLNKCDNYS